MYEFVSAISHISRMEGTIYSLSFLTCVFMSGVVAPNFYDNEHRPVRLPLKVMLIAWGLGSLADCVVFQPGLRKVSSFRVLSDRSAADSCLSRCFGGSVGPAPCTIRIAEGVFSTES